MISSLRRRAITFSALTVMVTVTVMVAGCGIPLDETPRSLNAGRAPDAEPTSVPTPGGSAAYVYLAVEDHVVPNRQEVGDGSPAARVQALLAIEPENGAASQIPKGTQVLSAVRNASVVTLDLSEEFDNLQGTARRLAAAQLVFTLTEVSGVEDVLFRVDGRNTRVDSPLVGDTDRVRACDYVSLLPTAQQLSAAPIDPDAARWVTDRRSQLVRRCPPVEPNATGE